MRFMGLDEKTEMNRRRSSKKKKKNRVRGCGFGRRNSTVNVGRREGDHISYERQTENGLLAACALRGCG